MGVAHITLFDLKLPVFSYKTLRERKYNILNSKLFELFQSQRYKIYFDSQYWDTFFSYSKRERIINNSASSCVSYIN